MEHLTGIITNIQKFSLHDGTGIRTTVFLKGCNMRCVWCHNPEAISSAPQWLFYKNKCIQCCAGRDEAHDSRGCPTGALVPSGREITVDAVMEAVLTDRDYYYYSNGGITLSGGEPFLQANFAEELLTRCKQEGIRTAVETNLSLPFSVIAPLLPLLDEFYCDLKLMDSALHQKVTGIDNETILKNLLQLKESGVDFVVRTPLIPSITDSDENVGAIARWLYTNAPPKYYELLNYNPLAKAKHEYAQMPYTIDEKPLSARRMTELADIAASKGLKIRFSPF